MLLVKCYLCTIMWFVSMSSTLMTLKNTVTILKVQTRVNNLNLSNAEYCKLSFCSLSMPRLCFIYEATIDFFLKFKKSIYKLLHYYKTFWNEELTLMSEVYFVLFVSHDNNCEYSAFILCFFSLLQVKRPLKSWNTLSIHFVFTKSVQVHAKDSVFKSKVSRQWIYKWYPSTNRCASGHSL